MSQYINLKPKGLFTYYNNLSEVEPGSLLRASNVNIDRDSIVTPRRGIKYYGSPISILGTDRIKNLLQYKNTLIRHFDDTLAFDDGAGLFTNFSGSYLEVVSKERMKSLETKGNLYFTTSEGVKKLSAKTQSDIQNSTPYTTGAPIAIGGSATPNYSVGGFLTAYYQAAYKTTWIIKDANGLLIEGVPSSNIIVQNYSTTNNCSADLTILIPTEVTVETIFRIYRVQESAIGNPLDFTYNLVFEGNPTSAEITAGKIVYNDFATETFRNAGEPLYTNSTAEGVLQANYRPPISRDIELFNNFTFYANTKTAQQINTTMLSTSGITAGYTKFTVTGPNNIYSIGFRGVVESSTIAVQGSAFITDQHFFLLNAANNQRKYIVWYDKTGTSSPPATPQTLGRIPIKVDVSAGPHTATIVGDRTAAAISNDPNGDFAAINTLGIVAVQNLYNGFADATSDSTDLATGFSFATTQNGLGEDASLGFALLSNRTTLQEQVEETAKSIVSVLSSIQKDYIVTYTSIADSTPGLISFQAVDQAAAKFYLTSNDIVFVDTFSPSLNLELDNSSIVGALVTTVTPHNLTAGTSVFLYGVLAGATNLSGQYTVLNSAGTYQYNLTTSLAGVTTSGFTIDATTGGSDNNTAINSLFFSKENQPESVPLVNQLLVGSSDAAIIRIKALRESLFIFKEDGLYRLSGYSADSFTVQLFDNTVILKCPDSIATVNNEIFYFGNQGVAKLSEVGKDVISKPIYNLLIPFLTTNTNLASATFGVAYESDRSYLIFTVLSSVDTYSKVCYRYNVDTGAWTSWNVSKTCAILKKDNDTLYFGSAIDNVIEQERKNFNRFDYADREIVLSLPGSSIQDYFIKPSSFNTVDAEDVITQTQYVTIYQFNQILQKLDLDNGMPAGQPFYPTFAVAQGDNLSSRLSGLVAELNLRDTSSFTDSNGNTSYVFSGATDFATIQVEYNKVIDRLNQSPLLFFINYPKSVGTTLHEAIMVEKDTTLKQFTMEKKAPFLQGPILVYKGIKTETEYVPQHGGDPSTLKQFSNGTLMFEYRSFYSAQVGFSSDLSMAYDNVTIKPISYGNWGDFTWGSGAVWGGLGDRVPLRTYIPAKKQRCRFLGARFAHGIALQSYAMFGLSLTYSVSGERAYK